MSKACVHCTRQILKSVLTDCTVNSVIVLLTLWAIHCIYFKNNFPQFSISFRFYSNFTVKIGQLPLYVCFRVCIAVRTCIIFTTISIVSLSLCSVLTVTFSFFFFLFLLYFMLLIFYNLCQDLKR